VEHPSMHNNNVISIDLAKNVFQVCLFTENRKMASNRKVTRPKLLDYVLTLDSKHIVMEACYSSNYWGRLFQKHGFKVGLIPPHQVKPFVVGNKNDHNDALAIAEASMRPKATFVEVKSLEKQDIQSLDRIRDRLIKNRTALGNQIRGLLAEYGIALPVTLIQLRKSIPSVLEDAENDLTTISREFISDMYLELLSVDEKILVIEKKAEAILNTDENYHRLQTIPGFGPTISRTLLCVLNDPKQFKNGRQLSAWAGITPKQHASGDQSRMGGITKRGNQTLRRQLIHGARAVVRHCEGKDDPLNIWIQKLLKTKQSNKVAVAVANKMLRMAWSVMMKEENYNSKCLMPT
jgi:transposase